MRYRIVLWTLASSLIAGAAHADGILGLPNPATLLPDRGVFIDSSAFLGSTFAPLKDAASDQWKGYAPRPGNNLDLVSIHARTGVAWNGWTASWLYRQDWLAEAHKDTLDAYSTQQLGKPFPTGAVYDVRYEVMGFEAQGLSLGKSIERQLGEHQFRFGLQVNALEGQRTKMQTARGTARATSATQLAIEGQIANIDSQLNTVDNNFNAAVRTGNPRGSGYSIDVGFAYTHPANWQVAWTANDAVSEITWQDVPEMTLSGTSVFNGQFPGGRKTRVRFQQTLPIKQALSLSVPWQEYRFEYVHTTLGALNFPALGIKRQWGNSTEVALSYDLTFRSVGLSYTKQYFKAALRTDTPDLDNARVLMLSLGLAYPF